MAENDAELMMLMARLPITMAELVQRLARTPGMSPLRRGRLLDIHHMLTQIAREATRTLTAGTPDDMGTTLERLRQVLGSVDDAMGDLEAALDAYEVNVP